MFLCLTNWPACSLINCCNRHTHLPKVIKKTRTCLKVESVLLEKHSWLLSLIRMVVKCWHFGLWEMGNKVALSKLHNTTGSIDALRPSDIFIYQLAYSNMTDPTFKGRPLEIRLFAFFLLSARWIWSYTKFHIEHTDVRVVSIFSWNSRQKNKQMSVFIDYYP